MQGFWANFRQILYKLWANFGQFFWSQKSLQNVLGASIVIFLSRKLLCYFSKKTARPLVSNLTIFYEKHNINKQNL